MIVSFVGILLLAMIGCDSEVPSQNDYEYLTAYSAVDIDAIAKKNSQYYPSPETELGSDDIEEYVEYMGDFGWWSIQDALSLFFGNEMTRGAGVSFGVNCHINDQTATLDDDLLLAIDHLDFIGTFSADNLGAFNLSNLLESGNIDIRLSYKGNEQYKPDSQVLEDTTVSTYIVLQDDEGAVNGELKYSQSYWGYMDLDGEDDSILRHTFLSMEIAPFSSVDIDSLGSLEADIDDIHDRVYDDESISVDDKESTFYEESWSYIAELFWGDRSVTDKISITFSWYDSDGELHSNTYVDSKVLFIGFNLF